MRNSKVFLSLLLIVFSQAFLANLWAMDRQTYQKILFDAEHSGDANVQKALQTLIKNRIIVADAATATRSSQPTADCQVLIGEGLIKSALMRDFMKKELPPQILELNLRFDETFIPINGRLDGPLFINPRFEARIEFAFLKTNVYRMNIRGLRVMGFEMDIFSSLLKKYIDDALKRVFVKGCTTKSSTGSDGSVAIDCTINPDGFVPGIGQKAVLSGIEMSGRLLRFSFSLTR